MNDYIEPYKTADAILDTFASVRIRMAIHEIETFLKERGCEPNNIRSALKQLEKDEYAEIDGNLKDWYIRTGKGSIFTQKGGYKAHFEKLASDLQEEEKRKQLTDKKLEIDLKNAERIYKTYFSTRAMAIIATAVSILLLLIKIAEILGWLRKL